MDGKDLKLSGASAYQGASVSVASCSMVCSGATGNLILEGLSGLYSLNVAAGTFTTVSGLLQANSLSLLGNVTLTGPTVPWPPMP
ncbi:MAG: hypothetical protein EBY30_17180 [Rhodospirillales bacterium]|nr:hypothetical protein [Rhodospirillales bacterium]